MITLHDLLDNFCCVDPYTDYAIVNIKTGEVLVNRVHDRTYTVERLYKKRITTLQETATFSTVTSHKNRLRNSYIIPCAYPTKFNQNICMKCLLPLRNWHFFFAIKK